MDVRRLGSSVRWLGSLALGSLVAGSLVVVAVPTAIAAPLAHHGDALVRVAASPAEVEALGLDVWTHGATEPSVVARVTLQQRALLDVSGLDYVVLDPDLGPRVQAERARLLAAPPAAGGLDPGYHDDYHGLQAVLARLAAVVATRPDRVSHVDLGLSLEGRLIRGIRITNPGADDRPVIVVQSGQHAREWISVAATMFAAEQFATAAEGTELDVLLDQAELWVVPVANPDGYVYTWEFDRFWRKNRRDGQGVDTNRNWAVAWGGEGSSADPAAENYRGTAPFSEPETVAMRDLVDGEPRVAALLDVHSYGQYVLFPWGYDATDSDDHELFAGLAADVADVMTSQHGLTYVPLQSAELYPAAGNTADWAYGTHGIYALALELRPGPESEQGFVLPPSAIVPAGEEVVHALAELVETTIELGPGEPGGGDTGTTGEPTTGALYESTSAASSTGVVGSTTAPAPASTTDPGADAPTPWGTSTTSDTDAAGELDTGDGCACQHRPATSAPWWSLGGWALGALGLGLRRRRPR